MKSDYAISPDGYKWIFKHFAEDKRPYRYCIFIKFNDEWFVYNAVTNMDHVKIQISDLKEEYKTNFNVTVVKCRPTNEEPNQKYVEGNHFIDAIFPEHFELIDKEKYKVIRYASFKDPLNKVKIEKIIDYLDKQILAKGRNLAS